MKKLVLITWFAMILSSPFIVDFASMAQLELAFLMSGLIYFHIALSSKCFRSVLIIFACYGWYIFLTDQFITYMPYIATVLESLLFFIILIVYSDE